MAPKHPINEDCDGFPIVGVRCPECDTQLCECEYGYGHDCEGD